MLSGHARGEGRDQGEKGGRPFIECIQWRDSRCTMVLTPWGSGPKNRGMTWPEWSRERLISLVCRRRRPALLIIPHGTLEHHSGFSETTDCIGSLSHLRDDFGCWNFLYPKSALNLIATLPMQACCNQECRAQQNAKNPTGYRRAAIVLIHDNQEA